jgi:hypothetical protein
MTVRRLVMWGVAGLTLAGTGAYVIIDLYRWEWVRAIMTALFFIAAEIGLIGWMTTGRIRDLEHRLEQQSGRRQSIARHLRVARERPSETFRWLSPPSNGAYVFVPLLMAAGIVLSALAWLLERLSRAVAGQTADARLADQLARLGPPPEGFLDDRDSPLRLLRNPVR